VHDARWPPVSRVDGTRQHRRASKDEAKRGATISVAPSRMRRYGRKNVVVKSGLGTVHIEDGTARSAVSSP